MVLKIGPIEVDPPVVLAPMAGVTNTVFRSLCRSYGAGLYVSEMMSARALVESNSKTRKMLTFGADETVRSVQLYGVDPNIVARAARVLVEDYGVDHIDMNFGCPASKVTRKGGGAALPVKNALFGAIVESAVRSAGAVPVTVKLRIGIDDAHRTALAAGRTAEAAGAAAVALHARTAEQLYSGTADWNAIGDLKAAITTVPVLGNGDIWRAHDALRMMDMTGCDGVVIGRGCLGRPWLFRDLVDVFAGRPEEAAPPIGVVVEAMRHHSALLCNLMGEAAGVLDFRKHVAWYLAGYPVGNDKRRALVFAHTLDDFHRALDELDPNVDLPLDAYALPRGHTKGPRRVRLPNGWLDDVDDLTPPEDADLLVSGG